MVSALKAEILRGLPEVSAKNFGARFRAKLCIPAVYCPHVGLLESSVFPEWISSMFAGKIWACEFLSIRVPRTACSQVSHVGERAWISRAMFDSALLTHPLTDRGGPRDFGANFGAPRQATEFTQFLVVPPTEPMDVRGEGR